METRAGVEPAREGFAVPCLPNLATWSIWSRRPEFESGSPGSQPGVLAVGRPRGRLKKVGAAGFEPATSPFVAMRSDPTELRAKIRNGQYGFLMPWEAFLLSGIREIFRLNAKSPACGRALIAKHKCIKPAYISLQQQRRC